MNLFLLKVPLLVPAVLFLLGSFLGLEVRKDAIIIGVWGLGILALVTLLIQKFSNHSTREVRALLLKVTVLACFLILGTCNSYYRTTPPANHCLHLAGKKVKAEGVVLTPIKKNKYGFAALVALDSLLLEKQKIPIIGKALVYFKALDTLAIESGERIWLKGNLMRIDSLKNPGYRKYLEQQQVWVQIKTYKLYWVPTPKNWLYQELQVLKRRWLAEMDFNFTDPSSRAIAKAFLLGIKTEIPYDLKSAYTISGVAHILALSGAHISMLLLLLQILFSPILKQHPALRYFSILFVPFLLIYAWLTGWSASVVRAAYMGSMLVLSTIFFRSSSIINAIAFCIILQLAIEPTLVQEAGFLLSYAAVLGIVLWQPIFERWIKVSAVWLRTIRDIISVTLSAQLFTLPIILYFFGTFPTYFLIANFVLNPLSFFILISGFIFILVCFIPVLNVLSAELCGYLIYLMNEVVVYISKLPYSQIEGIAISFETAVSGWLAILILSLILRYRL